MSAFRQHTARALAVTVVGGTLAVLSSATVGTAPARADVCPLPPVCIPTGTAPTATTPVSISGTPKVDQVLTANPPTWDTSNVTTTYQWQRAGAAISGATSTTYTVAVDDVDQAITVVATGSTSLASGTSTSDAVTGQLGDAPRPTAAMAVTGTPAVGSTLTVDPGTWTGDQQPTFTYQWFRSDGAKNTRIATATAATYTVTAQDRGLRLYAAVSGTRPGYVTGVALSSVAQVPKIGSTLALSLVKKTVTTKQRAQVRLVLTAADHSQPTGSVTIKDGGKKLVSYTFETVDDGVLKINLPKLKAGSHRLSASYAGSASTKAASSGTAVLTVTGKKKK